MGYSQSARKTFWMRQKYTPASKICTSGDLIEDDFCYKSNLLCYIYKYKCKCNDIDLWPLQHQYNGVVDTWGVLLGSLPLKVATVKGHHFVVDMTAKWMSFEDEG